MTISTLIHAGLVRPSKPRVALVLMGGGARTAYQAGVLKALADMLKMQAHQKRGVAFPISNFGRDFRRRIERQLSCLARQHGHDLV